MEARLGVSGDFIKRDEQVYILQFLGGANIVERLETYKIHSNATTVLVG